MIRVKLIEIFFDNNWFENLVNYDKSKTDNNWSLEQECLRTL